MQETRINKGQLSHLLIWPGVRITENGGGLLFGGAPWRRDPYVDGPHATRVFSGLIGSLASICPACSCGCVLPLAKMVFRDASSKHTDDLLSASGSHGLSRTSDRSILPSVLLLQLRLSRCGEPAERLIS